MSTAAKTKTMSEYVLALNNMQDNLGYGDLSGKVVADLATGDVNVARASLEAGAGRCYVVGDSECVVDDSRVVRVSGRPWNAEISGVDVALFDARSALDFDPVNGVRRLMESMTRVLTPQGLLFAVLKMGAVDHRFEVYNSVVQTPSGCLPSQGYLYHDLLKNYAVRMLDWLPSETPFETVRLFRIAAKKPTLLLASRRCSPTLSGNMVPFNRP